METLNELDCKRLLKIAMDIGEAMLRSGAEISRVEDTIVRICLAYKVNRVDVFTITSLIVASVQSSDDCNITQSRRIYSYTSNFSFFEKLNSLSRWICINTPPLEEAELELKKLLEQKRSIPALQCAGTALSAGSFALFFGGNFRDALVALLIGATMFLIETLFSKISINKIVQTLVSSIFAGSSALLLTAVGLGCNSDKIMIANVMILVPGIAIVNSVRDMLCGDTMAGLLRLIEAIIIAAAITVGFALPLIISNKIM